MEYIGHLVERRLIESHFFERRFTGRLLIESVTPSHSDINWEHSIFFFITMERKSWYLKLYCCRYPITWKKNTSIVTIYLYGNIAYPYQWTMRSKSVFHIDKTIKWTGHATYQKANLLERRSTIETLGTTKFYTHITWSSFSNPFFNYYSLWRHFFIKVLRHVS